MYASYTSVSTHRLMRVLPGCGITSPRLAWLKSYSGSISSSWFVGIGSPFRTAGLSGRNQPDVFLARIGIDNHQQLAGPRGAERDKALFLLPGIFAGQCERIAEDLPGLGKVHSMGAQILRRFGGVPGDPHGLASSRPLARGAAGR